MDHTVCAIFDGQHYCFGFSPGFEVPQRVMELISGKRYDMQRATYELGLTNNSAIGRAEGLIGLLSQGKIDRKEYTKPAIIMALIGLQNPQLYW
ncbi:DUF84 family protein [Candidatus Woesearchaeota archaeon]|nr:DUF84 family protein [Candidatus Woesearchaeota archaeon]